MINKKIKIGIIHGPNLNLLGSRETNFYGKNSLIEINKLIIEHFPNIEFFFFQSNVEGEIINQLHKFSLETDGIIINPAGYSHTSVSIADAISAINVPVIEVHISNIFARESYRHFSLTGSKCNGLICGFGWFSYVLAVYALMNILNS